MEGNWPFFVMDYFAGDTLASRIKSQGALGEGEALDILIQVCSALGYAHKQGVIHRDVKPSNIMLSPATEGEPPEICIVDFGIAKFAEREGGAAEDHADRSGYRDGDPGQPRARGDPHALGHRTAFSHAMNDGHTPVMEVVRMNVMTINKTAPRAFCNDA